MHPWISVFKCQLNNRLNALLTLISRKSAATPCAQFLPPSFPFVPRPPPLLFSRVD